MSLGGPRRDGNAGTCDAELAARLAAQARATFGVGCFWNVPTLAEPLDDAFLVAAVLRKYGGRRGWVAAAEIDDVLRAAPGRSDGFDGIPARGLGLSRP